MTTDSYGERAKAQLLHEYSSGDDISRMLEQSPTNSRTNSEMSIFQISLNLLASSWKGEYSKIFNNLDQVMQTHYLQLDGYARRQAIEMKGATTIAEQLQAKKEKTGLLSMLGLSKD